MNYWVTGNIFFIVQFTKKQPVSVKQGFASNYIMLSIYIVAFKKIIGL